VTSRREFGILDRERQTTNLPRIGARSTERKRVVPSDPVHDLAQQGRADGQHTEQPAPPINLAWLGRFRNA
jgi:hypothetical protein